MKKTLVSSFNHLFGRGLRNYIFLNSSKSFNIIFKNFLSKRYSNYLDTFEEEEGNGRKNIYSGRRGNISEADRKTRIELNKKEIDSKNVKIYHPSRQTQEAREIFKQISSMKEGIIGQDYESVIRKAIKIKLNIIDIHQILDLIFHNVSNTDLIEEFCKKNESLIMSLPLEWMNKIIFQFHRLDKVKKLNFEDYPKIIETFQGKLKEANFSKLNPNDLQKLSNLLLLEHKHFLNPEIAIRIINTYLFSIGSFTIDLKLFMSTNIISFLDIFERNSTLSQLQPEIIEKVQIAHMCFINDFRRFHRELKDKMIHESARIFCISNLGNEEDWKILRDLLDEKIKKMYISDSKQYCRLLYFVSRCKNRTLHQLLEDIFKETVFNVRKNHFHVFAMMVEKFTEIQLRDQRLWSKVLEDLKHFIAGVNENNDHFEILRIFSFLSKSVKEKIYTIEEIQELLHLYLTENIEKIDNHTHIQKYFLDMVWSYRNDNLEIKVDDRIVDEIIPNYLKSAINFHSFKHIYLIDQLWKEKFRAEREIFKEKIILFLKENELKRVVENAGFHEVIRKEYFNQQNPILLIKLKEFMEQNPSLNTSENLMIQSLI
jgi:hypothetical protein